MELRRRHLKLLRYVALFIAPVLILVFALQDISVPHVMAGNQLLAAQQILPGGAKDILTLDNGCLLYKSIIMSTFQNTAGRMTNYRWIICAMLFFATTVNYLDRQVLSLTWRCV